MRQHRGRGPGNSGLVENAVDGTDTASYERRTRSQAWGAHGGVPDGTSVNTGGANAAHAGNTAHDSVYAARAPAQYIGAGCIPAVLIGARASLPLSMRCRRRCRYRADCVNEGAADAACVNEGAVDALLPLGHRTSALATTGRPLGRMSAASSRARQADYWANPPEREHCMLPLPRHPATSQTGAALYQTGGTPNPGGRVAL
ncbi:hypothetical protein C8F04DRAFT_1190001 [Mycena alexandri]|uniref:Uncharacterized protein n=1 Tax=Mycena alexandri TaxID=1745969 RepID=A0AAD6SHJ4_9AGAR|nr:hypothetical protein C8F04DRAFT_1190001 [Mycena alexandri]